MLGIDIPAVFSINMFFYSPKCKNFCKTITLRPIEKTLDNFNNIQDYGHSNKSFQYRDCFSSSTKLFVSRHVELMASYDTLFTWNIVLHIQTVIFVVTIPNAFISRTRRLKSIPCRTFKLIYFSFNKTLQHT